MSSTFMPGRTPRNWSISAGLRPAAGLRAGGARSGAATTAEVPRASDPGAAAVGAGAGADLHAAAQAKSRARRFMGWSFREERVLQYPHVQRHPGAADLPEAAGPQRLVTLPWYVEFFRGGDY